MNTEKIIAPADWGTLKSNKYYALIDNRVCALRVSLEDVYYRGRWHVIQYDDLGDRYIDIPGAIISFTVHPFDK